MGSFIVPPHGHGLRLDAFLGLLFPDMGLRGRRRLWQWRRVLVNGCERPPGYTVAAGDAVNLEEPTADPLQDGSRDIAIIRMAGNFVAFSKPAGLHSAHVAGSPFPSLEALLPGLWGTLCAEYTSGKACLGVSPSPPRLLTRLDQSTSGIVLGTFCPEAQRRFRDWEAAGHVEKTYLAVTRGAPEQPLRIDRQLRVDGRRKTLVLDRADPDPARHTEMEPLKGGLERLLPEPFRTPEFFLARVRIRRGARHQIRAHLADAGYPLAGDTLYSGERLAESPALGALPPFLLHHAAVIMPDFYAECPVPWL